MFKKNPSPNFHGKSDIAPVPEMPPVSVEDIGKEFSPAPQPKNKVWIFIAIGIAVVVIGIGGAVFANYQGYLDFSFLPSKKDKIVDEILVAMQTVKQAKYNVAITSQTEPWDGVHEPFETTSNSLITDPSALIDSVIDMEVQLEIESYFSDSENLKDMDGYIKLSGLYGDSTMQLGLDLEIRKVGPDIYGMVSDYPELVAMFVPQLEELKGKWIKLTTDDEYGEYLDTVYNSSNLIMGDNSVKNFDLAFETGFVKFGKKLASEIIDGQPTMRYEMVVDMDNFETMYVQMITEAMKLQNNDDLMNDLNNANLDDINIEELFNPELRTNIEKFMGNLDVEMWVGDTDNIIRQIKATLVSVLPEEQRTAEVGQAQIEISVNLGNINETIEVAVPQSTISISDVQALFIDKDTDEDGLTDTEEATYGTEIDNPDTDGDGYKDGEEVHGGYNPLGEGELAMPIELDTTSMFDMNDAKMQSRDAKRLADINQVQNGLDLYNKKYGEYPSCTVGAIQDTTTRCPETKEDLEFLISGINTMIYDPVAGEGDEYCISTSNKECDYSYFSNGYSNYEIFFYLEDEYNDLAPGLHTATPTGIQ